MRRPIKNTHTVLPDERYDSELVARFVNALMLDGKKSLARTVVYNALDEIKNREGAADPLAVFEMAIQNVSPSVETRSRRVGGANYQVPVEVRPDRRRALAFRWLLKAARAGKGKPMYQKLADELVAASKNEGEAVKKKEDTHKMAEANRAFAHLAW
ncbi:MAG: 30S ribosomal protein S7 [Candidatus Paceibacteria bacterium]